MSRTYYHYDLNGEVIEETDENGNTIVEYTREPDGTLISEHRNGVSRHYHFDGQGNTLALTDDNGDVTDTFAYNASGDVTERTGTTPTPYQYHGQQGYYQDSETSDYHVQRRELDPSQGRWISADPLGFIDGMNVYLYVKNNPVNKIDPSGMVVQEAVCSTTTPISAGTGAPGGDIRDFLVASPPATSANACPSGYTFVRWKPLVGDEAKLAAGCAALPTTGACAACTPQKCEERVVRIIDAVRNTWVLNIFGLLIGTNTCQRWAFDLEPRLLNQLVGSEKCIVNANVVTFTVVGHPGSPKHAAYKITFCDGTVVYADNGAVGKGDHIFFPGDIPGDMTED